MTNHSILFYPQNVNDRVTFYGSESMMEFVSYEQVWEGIRSIVLAKGFNKKVWSEITTTIDNKELILPIFKTKKKVVVDLEQSSRYFENYTKGKLFEYPI